MLKHLSSRRGIAWFPILVVAIVIIILLVLIYMGVKHFRKSRLRAKPPIVQVQPPVRKTKPERVSYEITGPASLRQITHRVLPDYPYWAEEQGIMGVIQIAFKVNKEGKVFSTQRIVQTSGSVPLDDLALAAFKQWRFSEAEKDEIDESSIAFRFALRQH